MNPAQIDIEKVDKLTQIAARDGLAIFISVMVVCCMLPFLWFQFNRMYKVLLNIDKNTKGYISDDALKNVLEIYISDIRNKEQSFIYHKIENKHGKGTGASASVLFLSGDEKSPKSATKKSNQNISFPRRIC